ncbi:uncharacterized protein MONBRDRAFT_32595 [Monosiga brevicollis MX1]|uniref:DOCKER domain-containing protein n=1 Tax=Monosiga brevicollis TaxID=81824 RepID=A9V0K0_MONBE|nr:uncharacterized protein MONBRDRAFT_32595 [Monosiga brevicollis MX1]EDQ89165.1 predicted protein [Monosiga brevicollis MX1]|eukprot:XP_001746270.1 hypothetical protein [Monosiga brevicollis MX1]
MPWVGEPFELKDDEVRGLLVIFTHLVARVEDSVLRAWLRENQSDFDTIFAFLKMLIAAITIATYPGAVKVGASKLAPPSPAFGNHSDSDSLGRPASVISRDGRDVLHRETPSVDVYRMNALFVQNQHKHTEANTHEEARLLTKLWRNFSTEMTLTALQVIEIFMSDFEEEMQELECHAELTDLVFEVLMKLLRQPQSELALNHIFQTLQVFICKFSGLLFSGSTQFAATLCEMLLRHCNSPISGVREQAVALLFLTMCENDAFDRGFQRIKVQTTIALSEIVSGSDADCDASDELLRSSLATLISFANQRELVTSRGEDFSPKVRSLAMNLYHILRNSYTMRMLADSDGQLELHYFIAQGYKHSPDLRLTWLLTLAERQAEKKNYSEAAHCAVHAAGLVSEYLMLIEPKPGYPAGCAAFEKISTNVIEESALAAQPERIQEEGICSHHLFSDDGLMLSFLIPMYQSHRNFKGLHEVHSMLTNVYQSVLQAQTKGHRYFGTYYRVKFIGAVFPEELSRGEFIYKEPSLTKLPEICSRLEQLYTTELGPGNVIMIQDSREVEPAKLDPRKGYIQVTYVSPYHDEHELKHRPTEFERNINLQWFVFDTPFTKDGKAHGAIDKQYLRRTFLKTSATFPYLRMRLPVVQSRVEELTPLQFAADSIAQKTHDLQSSCNAETPNLTLLQLQLQGAVSAAVNEGPLHIAKAFFEGPMPEDYTEQTQLKKLRQGFFKFLKACDQALELNESSISDDQRAYHENMQRNFDTLRTELTDILNKASKGLQRARSQQSSMRRSNVSSLHSGIELAGAPHATTDV